MAKQPICFGAGGSPYEARSRSSSKAFGFVRDDVLKATSNAQEPFVYGSLGGNDVTLVPAATAPAAATPVDQDATMRRDY